MEARIRLVLDGKDYSAKMQIAENELQQLKRSAEGMRESIAGWGMAVTGFQSSLMLISQQLIPILSKPLHEAGQIEQYRTALKVMMGDTDKAEERLKELVNFAAETPFELPQVIEAGNKLQSLGRYSKELLKDLGDLASASGKPFEQVLSAFAKLSSGQKGIAVDMFRDLLITQEDWVKATGKTFNKNGEFVGNFEEMIEALPKIIKEKGFAGMMEEQSKTLLGKLSNLKDATGQTFAKIGEQMLPIAKDLLDTVIPAMQTFKDNVITVTPVIAGLTLSVILYTTALKAQALAESLSTASIKNNVVVLALKNITGRITTAVDTLMTASSYAYAVAQDYLAGKISAATARTALLGAVATSTGAVLTLLSAGIGVITVAWGVYEMTVAKSRREMVETEKEAQRLKLGMNDLTSKLDTMSWSNIQKEIEDTNDKIKEFNENIETLKGLSQLTPTGIPWLDAILTRGLSDNIYDQIEAEKGRIEVFQQYNNGLTDYQKRVSEAQKFTDEWNKETEKSILTLNQVKSAREKVLLMQGRAATSTEQEKIAGILKTLDQLEAKFKAGKTTEKENKKTHEQMLHDKISFYEELKKIDRSSLPDYKAYLEEQYKYYDETLTKKKGSLKNFTTEEIKAFNEVKAKLKEFKELETPHPTYELPPGLRKGVREAKREEQLQALRDEETLAQLRVDAIRDSFKREEAEIEKWYSENKETDLYLKSAEARHLIDLQYANKKRDLREREIEEERAKFSDIERITKDTLMEIGDLHKSGSEKWEAILEQFYNTALDLLTNYVIDYVIKMALTNPDKIGGLTETAEKVGEFATVTAANVIASNVAIAETTAAVVASMEAITASASTAATLVSIASFGGAALSGSAGVIAALTLIKGLTTSGGLVGFARGGAIVGEDGPELIAPIQTYIDVNRNLVTGTVMAVEKSLRDVRLQGSPQSVDLSKLEGLMQSHINEITKWKRELNFRVRGSDLRTAVDRTNSYYDKFEVI